MKRLIAHELGACTSDNVDIVSHATHIHETRSDKDTPRTREAVIWRINHRNDHANTIY